MIHNFLFDCITEWKKLLLEAFCADDDSQGVDGSIYGALSAHVWPGMILKSNDRIISEPKLPEKGHFLPFVFSSSLDHAFLNDVESASFFLFLSELSLEES